MEKRSALIICIWLFCFGSLQAQSWDHRLLNNCYNAPSLREKKALYNLSQSTYPISFGLPAGLLAYHIAHKDSLGVRQAFHQLVGLGVCAGISWAMKATIASPRPFDEYADITPYYYPDSYSLPSGHASMAFYTATSVSLQYRKWYVVVPAYAWAGGIGYSRMALGVHHPKDVACGAILGAASSLVAYKCNRWLHRIKHHQN